MQCTNPVRITKNLSRVEYPDGLEVPCGKCLACRIKKRSEWSARMLHELEAHKDAIFITLTYDDFNIPAHKSLLKTDLQQFFKRLRISLDRYNLYQQMDHYLRYDQMKHKIRYFACGEYGDPSKVIYHNNIPYVTEGDRPHYHAIIFNMSLYPHHKQLIIKAWNQGIVHFGLAEPDSINYVAQYIDKKFTGDLADTEYHLKLREPVFRLLSLGLGRDYVDNNSDQISMMQCITINGKKTSLPRYYINRLGLDISDLKQKAYEKECDLMHSLTGFDYSRDEAYRVLTVNEVYDSEQKIRRAKSQHRANLEAKVKLRQSTL